MICVECGFHPKNGTKGIRIQQPNFRKRRSEREDSKRDMNGKSEEDGGGGRREQKERNGPGGTKSLYNSLNLY